MATPENTPMLMQWITIEGERVPVALPQYWDYTLEKWVISGDKEKEALPVQNPGTLARLESLETKLDNVIEGDAFRTQLTGSNVAVPVDLQYQNLSTPLPVSFDEKDLKGASYEIETLFSGEIPAGGNSEVLDIITKDCPLPILLVTNDQQPISFSLRNTPYSGSGVATLHTFPKLPIAVTAPAEMSAHSIIPLMTRRGAVDEVKTLEDAKMFSFVGDGFSVTINNRSNELANVTLKIMRVWK